MLSSIICNVVSPKTNVYVGFMTPPYPYVIFVLNAFLS
uniref:Uncharacterized protein n=1 Tax=Arundo donax TaxID=35708 RepID=A0A0A9ELJ0_ARUDO